jgi:hypothetical protein
MLAKSPRCRIVQNETRSDAPKRTKSAPNVRQMFAHNIEISSPGNTPSCKGSSVSSHKKPRSTATCFVQRSGKRRRRMEGAHLALVNEGLRNGNYMRRPLHGRSDWSRRSKYVRGKG